ncbi:adhesion G-protein coupled receptor G6 isoform X13 [Amblyraja radiata]|uniref:adhesion G-protein coupled receptor G6 isoform X13 n=1 Tax=Amblyraja radiata TaxID=386614 RepID=UPI0014028660|nr:adhesion G-protein coupled receptor G6 isoform X13 [Amblyraja radiata]
MSHKARLRCVYRGGSYWRSLCCLAVFTSCLCPTAVLCCSSCTETLTGFSGQFTSPCYPVDYSPNLNCKWTILAPPGFIIQLTFHDFELEEAQGCQYDFVSIQNGAENIQFCGVTAKGHTLNSTTNEMVVTFKTDFSIQKKGFRASYRQVAVSLRNQKVVLDNPSQRQVVSVSPSVPIPDLEQFTVCLEAKSSTVKKNWILLSYVDSNNLPLIALRSQGSDILLAISNVECDVSQLWEDHFSGEAFTAIWQQLCVTWDSASGDIITQTQNKYQVNPCSASRGKSVAAQGSLTLAPEQKESSKTFTGELYNFRLWDFNMTGQMLVNLSCDEVGNVVDWENSFWDIPVSTLEADSDLSCASAIPTNPTVRPTCSSLGSGCQATTPVNSNTLTTNLHVTNSVDPSTDGISTPFAEVTTHGSRDTTDLRQQNNTVSQNTSCNCSSNEGGIFYRTQFSVYDQSSGNTDMGLLKQRVSAWLTTSFQDWNYTVYVESVSIFEGNATSAHRISARSLQKSYNCLAILYYNITKNIYLEERVVQERLINKSSVIGNNLSINSIHVQPIVNCTFEKNPQYTWTSTRPMSTLLLPCHTNPSQFASRKCILNTQNYTSYWESPNMSNCSISSNATVSAENAAEVAFLLLDYSADKNLTREEVDLLLDTLNQIVIVAEINSSLASTVLTVLSNILSSSDTALTTSSQVALRTVDALTAKMIFDGPSVNISTPNLAIGISTIDAQTYNGTSFRLGSHNGESELEVTFDGKARTDSLAEVELPLSVLEKLTEEEANAVSRAQFAFFRRTGLFQDPRGFDLQSFVVASSLDNITISNLSEPVRIRIRHRNPQEAFKPLCAFWDLTLNNDSGGWNTQGCRVDPRSSANETICLCNHLTHFGILLDISGMAQKIDAVNTKILTFITHIGCGISAIFSATTLLTYVAFDKLRRDYPSKILMNLSTSLFFLNFIFLINGWIASFNIAGLCIAVAVLLHFFLLASFTWMGLEAVHMYIALVKVFNTYIRKYMLKFCIIGWGLPALVVLIVFSIRTDFYGVSVYGKDDTDSGSEFCWIEEKVVFYVTCVCYFAILFLMNISMFVVVLIQICGRNGKKSNRNLREEILRNLRSVTSLTFLLGMTWGFAFFAWGPVHLSFMYLFAIFNSIQGFFIFVFHCALKENVQKQWRRYLCCGRFRLSENSDWSRTITNTTKKVSSENLGKSLSSSSIGSNSTSWTSKFKSGSSLFKSSTKDGLFAAVRSSKFGHLDARQDPIVPIHNGLDKVSSYYPTHSDNFYKNIMMSENFSHSTKF